MPMLTRKNIVLPNSVKSLPYIALNWKIAQNVGCVLCEHFKPEFYLITYISIKNIQKIVII